MIHTVSLTPEPCSALDKRLVLERLNRQPQEFKNQSRSMDRKLKDEDVEPNAAKAIKSGEARYRDLMEFVPLAVVRLDRSRLVRTFARLQSRGVPDLGRCFDQHPRFLRAAMNAITIVEANRKAAELFGAKDVEQLRGSAALLWTEDPEIFEQSIKARYLGANRFEAQMRIRTFQNEVRHVFYVTTFPIARLGLTCLIDIDDRIKAEEALAMVRADIGHASRLSTLGELTASIAHEINQPLTSIMAGGEAALSWLSHAEPNVSELRELSSRILLDAQRASDIIERIRATIARKEPEPTRIVLNDLVEDVIRFLGPEFSRQTVDVTIDRGPESLEIFADRIQVQQVVVNLAMNAIQAMTTIENRPRKLTFRTGETATVNVLEVEDSGPGLTPHQMDNMFKAFFTTKSSERA